MLCQAVIRLNSGLLIWDLVLSWKITPVNNTLSKSGWLLQSASQPLRPPSSLGTALSRGSLLLSVSCIRSAQVWSLSKYETPGTVEFLLPNCLFLSGNKASWNYPPLLVPTYGDETSEMMKQKFFFFFLSVVFSAQSCVGCWHLQWTWNRQDTCPSQGTTGEKNPLWNFKTEKGLITTYSNYFTLQMNKFIKQPWHIQTSSWCQSWKNNQ